MGGRRASHLARPHPSLPVSGRLTVTTVNPVGAPSPRSVSYRHAGEPRPEQCVSSPSEQSAKSTIAGLTNTYGYEMFVASCPQLARHNLSPRRSGVSKKLQVIAGAPSTVSRPGANCKLGSTNSEMRIALLGDYSAVGPGPGVLRKMVIIAYPMTELPLPEVSPGEPLSPADEGRQPPRPALNLDIGKYSRDHHLSSAWVLGQPGHY